MSTVLRTVGVWQVCLDPTSKREYYCNTSTGVTVWEAPAELAGGANKQQNAPSWNSDLHLFGVWQVLRDPSTNREYFFNTIEEVTTWVCPPEIQDAYNRARSTSPTARTPYASQHPWDLFFDQATSRSYFYNKSTGATTWECPPEVKHLVKGAGNTATTTATHVSGGPVTPLFQVVEKARKDSPKLTQHEGTVNVKVGKKLLPKFVRLKEGELSIFESKEATGKAEVVNVVETTAEIVPDNICAMIIISRGGKPVTQFQVEKKTDETMWAKVLQTNGCNDVSAVLKEGTLAVKGAKKPRRVTLHADRICCYKLAAKPDSMLLLSTSTEIVCATPMEFELKDANGLGKGKAFNIAFNTESMEQRDEWVAAIEGVTKCLLTGVFGGQLNKGILSSEYAVPAVIYHSLAFLNQHGLKTEGIFRVPGATNRIQELRKEYNEYRVPTMNAGDVHSVAGLVKLYFRELADPLIPAATRDQIIRLNCKSGQDMDKKMAKLKSLLDQLPPNVLITLNYMIYFLTLVAAQSSENKMAADNCGMVFAPGLMKNKELEESTNQMKMSEDMAQCEACIQLMIVKYPFFFPAGPPYQL